MSSFIMHQTLIGIAIISGIITLYHAWRAFEASQINNNTHHIQYKNRTIIFGIITACAIGFAVFLSTQTESFQRELRTAQSNYDGGLVRTVTVYSYTGEQINSWSGKFDVEANGDSNEVMFDSENGRVIVEGGIVVIEEQH